MQGDDAGDCNRIHAGDRRVAHKPTSARLHVSRKAAQVADVHFSRPKTHDRDGRTAFSMRRERMRTTRRTRPPAESDITSTFAS
jgi:hypothetical protein